jgi:NTP pyrophosphatase (non-canonical NTP hydrolase)
MKRPKRSKRSKQAEGQILLFPGSAALSVMPHAAEPQAQPDRLAARQRLGRAVLSGSFRKDPGGLRSDFEELQDLGWEVLSPHRLDISREEDGFIYMVGEETSTPQAIESRHLQAIEEADFVWLHAPEGYLGLSASLEIGFASAVGVPIFAKQRPADSVLADFVHVISSPRNIPDAVTRPRIVHRPSLASVQEYYRRIATERGFEKETAQECFMLLVEEVGEFARTLRKRTGIARHQQDQAQREDLELADILLYVVHMANLLGVDLTEAIREKEEINLARFLARNSG